MIQITWVDRKGGGRQAEVEGLGLVELYRMETYGLTCVINNRIAWSGIRAHSIASATINLNQRIRDWHYINQFKVREKVE